jgi:hypothetical protein
MKGTANDRQHARLPLTAGGPVPNPQRLAGLVLRKDRTAKSAPVQSGARTGRTDGPVDARLCEPRPQRTNRCTAIDSVAHGAAGCDGVRWATGFALPRCGPIHPAEARPPRRSPDHPAAPRVPRVIRTQMVVMRMGCGVATPGISRGG